MAPVVPGPSRWRESQTKNATSITYASVLQPCTNSAPLVSRPSLKNVRHRQMLPIFGAIRARGITTLAGIADELTRQKWPTARGAESWSMMAVSNILKRTRSK